jgi:hypothetical protein
MNRFAIAACLLFAALPACAHTLFLDVDGKQVEVETSGPPVNAVLEDGRQVATWKAEDAAAIARTLAAKDLAWAIPGALGGLKVADKTPNCLSLDLADYGVVNVTLPGKVTKTATGRVVWTESQIAAIQARLHDIGREDALPLAFGLTLRTLSEEELATVSAQGDTILKPGCGECLTGQGCIYNGVSSCCAGAGGTCTACKTCAPKRGGGGIIEPEL